MAKPWLLDIGVSHHCWCVETTEKAEDCVTQEARNYTVIDGKARYNATITSSNLEKDLKLIQSHPLVKQIDVLYKTENTANAMMISQYDSTVLQALDSSGCHHLGEGISKHGYDNLVLMAPNQENIKEFMDTPGLDITLHAKKRLKKTDLPAYDFFRESGFLKMRTAVDMLSPKQKDVFELACKKGYYGLPKKVTISELGNLLGLSESTTREHLRKAESVLNPMFFELMDLVTSGAKRL